MYNVMYRGRPHIANMELQTGADSDMALRMLSYHVGLHVKHRLPVLSIILNPFETTISMSPYQEMSGDEELLKFQYRAIVLSTLDALQFVRDLTVAMYTLLPAMKNVSIPLLMQAAKEMNQYYPKVRFGNHLARFMRILQRSKTLSEQEKQTMHDNLIEYDSLIDDNPDMQKRVAKGETRGHKRY